MLAPSISFQFVTSLIIIILASSPSVSISNGRNCSTDDDCDLELMCNLESSTCTCPESYFWRDDINRCLGCAPEWQEFETSKCLLFAVAHAPGATWNEAKITCESLMGQPMLINSVDEFVSLQRRVKYLLDKNDALAATLYFHQGAWIQLDHQQTELYIWCHEDEQLDHLECVQVRQDTKTDAICLQHVACSNRSQYICEAPPLVQIELATNMANEERTGSNARINPTAKPTTVKFTTRATVRTTPMRITTKVTARPTSKTTVKHSIGQIGNNIAGVLTSGFNAVGNIANALGSSHLLGGIQNLNQNLNQNLGQNLNQQGGFLSLTNDGIGFPDALEQAVEDLEKKAKMKKMLLYGGIGGGILLLVVIAVIVICCVGTRMNKTGDKRTSIDSSFSEASFG